MLGVAYQTFVKFLARYPEARAVNYVNRRSALLRPINLERRTAVKPGEIPPKKPLAGNKPPPVVPQMAQAIRHPREGMPARLRHA